MQLCDLLQMLYPFFNINGKTQYEFVQNIMYLLMREPLTEEEEEYDEDEEYYP